MSERKEGVEGVTGVQNPIPGAQATIMDDLGDSNSGKNFSNYLNNPNTLIVMQKFPKLLEWFKQNPVFAAQVLLSTTNCIDGRPVLLHNSSILLLKFLVEQKGIFDDKKLNTFIDTYLSDPIRKDWFERQDNRKINKSIIIRGIQKCYNDYPGISGIFTIEDFDQSDKEQAVDLLTEGSGYPGGGLGFAINYADALLKNRNEVCNKLDITSDELKAKIENFFRTYGGLFYYHSCNGNYGNDCKYAGCAAMKYFMNGQEIDSQVQSHVDKYVLTEGGRKRSVLNGAHEEDGKITISNPSDNKYGIGIRNDVSTKKDLGPSQSFVLNLQLERVLFDTVTSVIFPEANLDNHQYLRKICSKSLKKSLGEINEKLGKHKIKVGTVITGPSIGNPAINDIGSLLKTL